MSFFSNYIYIIDEFEEELIMNYYEEIKDLIEKKEVKDGVRRLSYNSDKLKTYYEIGKLLVEAQGGEERAKYGNSLIKKWSLKLVEQYGRGYNISNLKRMRQFYTIIQKGAPLEHQLNISWTNWKYLLPIKNENERNYYINQCILNNLSKRELAKLIKEKAYDRLSYADKNNIKIINSKNEASYSLKDMLLDPIIIKSPGNENISEKVLKKYILDVFPLFSLFLGIFIMSSSSTSIFICFLTVLSESPVSLTIVLTDGKQDHVFLFAYRSNAL